LFEWVQYIGIYSNIIVIIKQKLTNNYIIETHNELVIKELEERVIQNILLIGFNRFINCLNNYKKLIYLFYYIIILLLIK